MRSATNYEVLVIKRKGERGNKSSAGLALHDGGGGRGRREEKGDGSDNCTHEHSHAERKGREHAGINGEVLISMGNREVY